MSTQRVTVLAPAKINWMLEVLGRRPDGYHEVRTVLQTISLSDTVILQPAAELTLSVRGGTRAFRREMRASPESNLAFRAARLLRERTRNSVGVEIWLSKHVPVAAGLGGGSSDAAAVLRGLRVLWKLDISDEELSSIGAELGSDVPFFLRGGTAIASGRGEVVEPLPDAQAQQVQVTPPRLRVVANKTARMYGALRPEYCTDGSRTEALAERIRHGEPVRDEDCFNVFEQVLPEVDPERAAAFEAARDSGRCLHLCGSGPAYFTLAAGGTYTLSATEATRISEVAKHG